MWRLLTLVLLARGRGDCFLRLEKPLKEPPFSDAEEAELWNLFEANINVNGTGAVIASPGACPALEECCDIREKMPYGFHWTRDASLSLLTLLEHARPGDEASFLQVPKDFRGRVVKGAEQSIMAFTQWVKRSHARTAPAGNIASAHAAEEAFLEPKWTFDGEPYKGGWCRPQTDGPPLRARLLMRAAQIYPHLASELLTLAQKDLDWLAENHAMESCDLWEETRDGDFLWNRVVQLAALAEGYHTTKDPARKQRYLAAAQEKGAALENHVSGDAGEEFLTNCPASDQGPDCVKYNKTLDGVLVLTLIHGQPMAPSDFTLPSFLEASVANTVRQLSRVFCSAYPVNRRDSEQGVPGVLLGRYAKDAYGHRSQGNPWVLITASLANLLYKAAAEAHGGQASPKWQQVFQNGDGFTGSTDDFVAAGDAVLMRLRHHMAEGMHLFEQIDKDTGLQYNAEDLTWSYSEVLDALHARKEALRHKLSGPH